MLEYNLLKGKVKIENNILKADKLSIFKSIKWKFLSIVGAFYIYDRVDLMLTKDSPLLIIILKIIFYGCLSIFVLWSIYYYWIKTGLTNKLKLENLSKIYIYYDEETPLNINTKIKGKFNTIKLTFRKTEKDLDNFLKELRKNNSRFTIIDDRNNE